MEAVNLVPSFPFHVYIHENSVLEELFLCIHTHSNNEDIVLEDKIYKPFPHNNEDEPDKLIATSLSQYLSRGGRT